MVLHEVKSRLRQEPVWRTYLPKRVAGRAPETRNCLSGNGTSKRMVEVLIANGAPVNAENDEGHTPLDLTSNKQAATVLKWHGTDTDSYISFPFNGAARRLTMSL